MFEMAADFAKFNTEFEVMGGYLSPVGDAYKKAGLASSVHRSVSSELPSGALLNRNTEYGCANWPLIKRVCVISFETLLPTTWFLVAIRGARRLEDFHNNMLTHLSRQLAHGRSIRGCPCRLSAHGKGT